MTRPLPVRPDLMQLRRQAKELLKAHHSGDASVCRALSYLPRFRGKSTEQILSASPCLSEVQHALARTYGFPNWGALKRQVEAVQSARAAGASPPRGRSYAYLATDAAQELREGVVVARDLGEALAAVREDGVLSIEIARVDRRSGQNVRQRVRAAVELLLYEGAAGGIWAMVFNCTGSEAMVGLQWTDDSPVSTLLRTGLDSSEVLDVLRRRSGEARLGRRTIQRRVTLHLGHCLPDLHPQKAEVEFVSSDDESCRIYARMLMPGSSGCRRMRSDDLLDAILEAKRERGRVHVLTSEETQARQLARSLSNRLDESVVGFMQRSAKQIPKTAVVVTTASAACFAYIRARMATSKDRDALERDLASTIAVCVDISQQEHMTPCEIKNRKEGSLSALRIRPYLMLYGKVVEPVTER